LPAKTPLPRPGTAGVLRLAEGRLVPPGATSSPSHRTETTASSHKRFNRVGSEETVRGRTNTGATLIRGSELLSGFAPDVRRLRSDSEPGTSRSFGPVNATTATISTMKQAKMISDLLMKTNSRIGGKIVETVALSVQKQKPN
jgi:hypothetical protein